MTYSTKKLVLLISTALGSSALVANVSAAGLSLSQLATAESIGTAGVANVTNNRDASAVMGNPAGLSGISDSSTMIGVQYLDVEADFTSNNTGRAHEGSTGEAGQFTPNLSYGKRLDDSWVVGMGVHAPGGLGLSYDNGVAGGPLNIINDNNIAIVNLTTALAYQANDSWSLGASIIAQYAEVAIDLFQDTDKASSLVGENWAPSFALGAMYHLSQKTHLGVTYNYGAKHNLDLTSQVISPQAIDVNWPQSVDVGLAHQLNAAVTLMVSGNWQQWSEYDERYSDTWGGGVALSYELSTWILQAGVSVDSSPLTAESRDVLLPLDKQWRVGIGAVKRLKTGSELGLAYQYQSLGDGEITGNALNPIQPSGYYSNNRVHFVGLSLSF
ncbi:OmpP1/FadL family transporter [Shewanella colwelliana]|uniref:OmpP1/FadL family transporter n=1 Tax=Shewanella colwelliana TaxID=23 RepID=UPI0022AEE9ED|nr:outer membrane protein transport protein [Shewanella colwelliana]MCZ4336461.1 outer membrane protein transport protein [Shewanella colwelliana]